MRRCLSALTVAAALLAPAPARAQGLLYELFGDYVESLRAQAQIPGLAAGIVGQTDVLWERAFGLQDVERALPARTDTPFPLDGLTQTFTAALVLRCVEEGRLTLDDEVGRFVPDSPEPHATLGELLTHTVVSDAGRRFNHQLPRLDPLAAAIEACAGEPLHEAAGNLADRLGMTDTAPGQDVAQRLADPGDALRAERYRRVLERQTRSYAVPRGGEPIAARHPAATLTPTSGLVSSVRDLARFHVDLRSGVLLQQETLAQAWTAPVGIDGERLPHGAGWFVQTWGGEPIVWQFGLAEHASSSLVVFAPAHGLTLILLANSDGLAKPFDLAAGDVTQSPFARLFIELFLPQQRG